jgi:anti-sigma regulatory factor (Ser/Thr protein kinase)
MGSLPVSEIFNQHVLNQASISQMASEINQRLVHLLPGNMFFCAAIFELDYLGTSLTLWMGGMNDLILVNKQNATLSKMESVHLPLGILSDEEFDDSPRLIELEDYSRIYFCTDGIIEAENKSKEQFGQDRLDAVILEHEKDTVPALINAVNQFAQNDTLNDDVSIVELITGKTVHCARENDEVVDIGQDYHKAQSVPWNLHIELHDDELRSTSVVNQVMAFVSSIQGIELHQDKIFTIVSELYSNSLEHGVLGLSSDLKETADGFEEYYKQRESRLAELEGQFINIKFQYLKGDPNSIELTIEDSGEGFDIEKVKKGGTQDEHAHGRGLNLLLSLCSELEYQKGGREVRAVYQLTRH